MSYKVINTNIVDYLKYGLKDETDCLVKFTDLPKGSDKDFKWISVSERLPEKSGLYLTSIGDLVSTYPFDGHNFRLRDNTRIIHVDAWMPLPEPYKGS